MKPFSMVCSALAVALVGCSSAEGSVEGLFVAAEPQACASPSPNCVHQSLRLFRDDKLWEGGVEHTGLGPNSLAWKVGPFSVAKETGVLVITGQGLSERRLTYKFVDGRLVTGDGNGWVRPPSDRSAALQACLESETGCPQ